MNSILNWKYNLVSSWKALPLKSMASYYISSVDKITNENEYPIQLCNYTDVYNNEFITLDIEFMNSSASSDEIKKFSLLKGDVLITKDSESWDDIGIPSLVVDVKPGLLCGYHLALIRPEPKKLYSGYLFRCIQSKTIRTQLELSSTGVTRYGLPKDAIGKLILPIPEFIIQKRISLFLDKETQSIAFLIKAKEKLISLISEKRQALINEIVKKGLYPNAQLKNSDINWLGLIPAHWEMKRLKHITKKIGSGITPKGGAEVYLKEGIPLLRSQNVYFDGLRLEDVAFISQETHNSMLNSKVELGDVLLNITGGSIGRCFYYESQSQEANVNQHVCIVRPNNKVLTKYLYFFLISDLGQNQISVKQVGGGREGLNFEELKSFVIPLPPLNEQKEIVDSLQQITGKIDDLKKATERSIELLKERKDALIAAAVTGQIEIPSEQ